MYYTDYSVTQSASRFMTKVFSWMTGALAVTAITAWTLASNPAVFAKIFHVPGMFFVLAIAQLGLVITMSAFVQRISYSAAIICFLGYSFLSGVTLSSIFYVFDMPSIITAFAVATGMFAFMAIYGALTRSDLTGIGSLAIMALFGLILATIVNIFVGSAALDYYISLFGVGIFTVLIAYDAQKIKQMGQAIVGHSELENKIALCAALTLYLDFINLFLYLLRLFGKQNDRR
jgi:uncharacterized protein